MRPWVCIKQRDVPAVHLIFFLSLYLWEAGEIQSENPLVSVSVCALWLESALPQTEMLLRESCSELFLFQA